MVGKNLDFIGCLAGIRAMIYPYQRGERSKGRSTEKITAKALEKNGKALKKYRKSTKEEERWKRKGDAGKRDGR